MRSYIDRGYSVVKMKIGGASLDEDLRRIDSVLSILQDGQRLCVDANGRFDLDTAIAYAKALSQYDLFWYEEPGDPLDYELQATLRNYYKNPMATGENLFSMQDARNLVRYGGMRPDRDWLQFDCALSYGLVEYLRTLDMLKQHGWSASRCIPHGGHQMSLNIAAGLGLGGNESYPDLFQPYGGFPDGVKVENSYVDLPDLPGIGFEGKSDLIREMPASHLCGLMLQSALKTTMTTVPYKGTAPAMTDLIGGQVNLMCEQATNAVPQIEGGKVKVFGVTSQRRLAIPALKDAPTLAEGGLKDFNVQVWHAVYAPKGTPAPVLAKLNAAVRDALKDPELVKRQEALGLTMVTDERLDPAGHRKFVEAEKQRWAKVIKDAGEYALGFELRGLDLLPDVFDGTGWNASTACLQGGPKSAKRHRHLLTPTADLGIGNLKCHALELHAKHTENVHGMQHHHDVDVAACLQQQTGLGYLAAGIQLQCKGPLRWGRRRFSHLHPAL
jgi:hypothetical protein